MRAAFIPALPPSALLAGMIAPSFRLVNRFSRKSCCACPAPRGRGPCCARYSLGRRSLAGGSHTHPTLAVAWAVFAANGGGASVSSAHLAQETRHVPPGTDRRRASRPHQPSEVWRGLAVPVAQSSRWALAAPSARFAPHLRVALPPSAASAHRAHASLRCPPNAFRIQRHARWIRWPCVSKASLRRPPPAPKGSVCPVGTCAKRKATCRCAGRKRVPCGHLGRRPKAT